MNVAEIMTNVVLTVTTDDSLQNAAAMMNDNDTGCLLVREHDQLQGVLTDRDIVIRALAHTSHVADISVGEIMSRKPVCCHADDSIQQAAIMMEDHQVRRLPVLDSEEHLAGIVSLGDIATHAHDDHLSAELIEHVSLHVNVYCADLL